MDWLTENWDQIREGFISTIWLFVISAVMATVLGTILASFRVSPILSLRATGTSYVNIFRNTPLVLVLALATSTFPPIGFNDLGFSIGVREFSHFFVLAAMGLAAYTAAFVCEALRSGINSIPLGQAEAARAIGMPFGSSMTQVILPQAFRSVIAPLASTYIALAKNTSVVAIFGVPEAAYVMRKLITSGLYADEVWLIFIGFALGYMAIVAVISGIASLLESRLRVRR
jgi:glutamate transport system permease protein